MSPCTQTGTAGAPPLRASCLLSAAGCRRSWLRSAALPGCPVLPRGWMAVVLCALLSCAVCPVAGCPEPWASVRLCEPGQADAVYPEQVKSQRVTSRVPHEPGIARRTTFGVHTPDSCQPSAEDLVGTEELWAAELHSRRLACWGVSSALQDFWLLQASRHTLTSVIPARVDKTGKGGRPSAEGPEPRMEQRSRWKPCPENMGAVGVGLCTWSSSSGRTTGLRVHLLGQPVTRQLCCL